MPSNTRNDAGCARERGATLVLVSLAMIALLAVMALAVDLGMLYVARNDAQRAADAAALAGANTFQASGCMAADSCGIGTPPPEQAPATAAATSVAAEGSILGQPAQVNGISFSYPNPQEPQITVTVQRSDIPLIFAKIFGSYSGTVAAKATAEAYQGKGISVGRLLPFIVPNCNPWSPSGTPSNEAGQGNGTCATFSSNNTTPVPYPASEFIAKPTDTNAGYFYPQAIGQTWTLHYSDTLGVPSQFYMVDYGNSNSGSVLNNEIISGVDQSVSCGTILPSATGNKASIIKSVQQRIYAANDGLNQGQDAILSPLLSGDTAGPPDSTSSLITQYVADYLNVNFTPGLASLSVLTGSGTPQYSQILQASGGTGIYSGTTSSSIAAVPVYDALYPSSLCAGSNTGSCYNSEPTTALNPGGGNQVQIIGFMNLFIVDAYHVGGTGSIKAIDVVILGSSGCNGSISVATAPEGGVPIRLIQEPTGG